MKTISISEARQHLSKLIDAAERGEGCIITRHGKQIARILPVEDVQRGRLPDLTSFRESIRTMNKKPPSLVDAELEGRRECRY